MNMSDWIVVRVTEPGRGIVVATCASNAQAHEFALADRGDTVVRRQDLRYPNGREVGHDVEVGFEVTHADVQRRASVPLDNPDAIGSRGVAMTCADGVPPFAYPGC
jgi:hypothetical protein